MAHRHTVVLTGKEENPVSYQQVPHAAVNVLMQWVRQQGQHIVSLHTWPHLAGWSELSEWSAHIEVQGTPPVHVRIKRKGYQFAIVPEPDGTGCPACVAPEGAARVSLDPMGQAADLTTQSWCRYNGVALSSCMSRGASTSAG